MKNKSETGEKKIQWGGNMALWKHQKMENLLYRRQWRDISIKNKPAGITNPTGKKEWISCCFKLTTLEKGMFFQIHQ